jgi:RHS repeat-associated protein
MKSRCAVTTEYSGRIDGKFDVDGNGGATYSIGIQVPPGTGGLQPSLQLAYNSHLTELGTLGVGWRLSGLSAITRVAATIAQDGVIGRVEYSAGDRFALDGARLMTVEGEYGAANAVYRTEVEQWMKVVPNVSGVAGRSGPDSFTVQSKDRRRFEFGNSDDSRVLASTAAGKANPSVRTWLVNKITDRNGNTMTFHYTQDAANNAAYPESIVYGGRRKVQFKYINLPADSPDAAPQFIGGYPTAVTKLLESISTYVDDRLVLTYRIAYTRDGVTRRHRIASITVADRDGHALPATSFAWQDGAPSLFGKTSSLTLSGDMRGSFIPMDVNGDGLMDIVNASSVDGKLALSLYLGRNDGTFEAPVSIPVSGLAGNGTLFPLDIDADGCTDLVYTRGEDNELAFTIFHARQIDGRWTLEQGPTGGGGPKGLSARGKLASLDFDGDGKIDLVHYAAEDGLLVLRPLRSTGTAFVLEKDSTTVTDLRWFDAAQLIPLDYDGDGKGDLAYARNKDNNLQIRLLRSNGTRFIAEASDAAIGEVPYSPVLFGFDANNDGKPDLIAARIAGDTLEVRTLLSNGIGLEPPQLSTFAIDTRTMPRLLPARLTGGLPDLIVQTLHDDVVRVRVLSSNGARFVERTNVSQPFTTKWHGGTLMPADVDGDGRTDLLAIERNSAGDQSVVTFTSALAGGAVPDLVQRITDGFGEHVSIAYKPLTDSSVYRKADVPPGATADPRALLGRGVSGATFDLRSGNPSAGTTHSTMSVQFAKMVVASYERPGAGTQRFHFDRFYSGARVDLEGRGWLAFATMEIRERGRNTKRETRYRQDFPFAGAPRTDELRRVSDNRLLERTTYQHVDRIDGKIHEARLMSHSRATFGGPTESDPLIETSAFEYDGYGNVTLESVSATGATSKPFYTRHKYSDADKASWKLGLEIERKITSDAQGQDVLLHRTFAYDKRANRIEESVWDEAHRRFLTTKYEHDTFGNEVAVTAASGATGRTSYDASNTFPRQTTHPANDAGVTLLTDHEYDTAFGVEISRSQPYVPNALPRVRTKQQVDGLGRVIAALGPSPAGQLVTMKKIVRGRDETGPYEEEQTLQDWAGTSWRRERKYWTSTGAVFATRTTGPDGKRDTLVERTLDSDGRNVEETLLHYEGAPARKVLRTFDELGRLVKLERPLADGRSTIAVTECLSATEEHSTEAFGTAAARTTKRKYGYFGGKRVIVERIDPLGGVTTFDYDARARSIRGTDPKGVVTTSAYDFADRQTSLEVRSGNVVQTKESVEHDDVKLEMVRTDARGTRMRMKLDAMNRLLRRGPEGGHATVYTYDDAARSNTLSRLAKVTVPEGISIEYDYDDHGNCTLASIAVDGATHTLRTSFTPSAHASRMTYPDGSIVNNVYNADGSLVAIEDGDGLRYATYDDFTALAKPQTIKLRNDTHESLAYNDVGQLTSQTITRQSTQLAKTSMQWNELYQLTQIADSLDAKKTQTFSYDRVGRLLRATGHFDEPQEFAYDLAGNLTQKGAVTFDVEGHQVRSGRTAQGTVFSAQYDAAGNITRTTRGDEQRHLKFDADSQLVEASGTTFIYDHTGARVVKRSAGGVTTYYIAGLYEVTAFPDGARQSTCYIQGPHGVVASKTRSETGTPTPVKGVPAAGTYYFHTNQINSTTLQTNAAGVEVCRVEYLPFGEIQRITGRDIFRQKFTGNELDYETGLYYFKSRYYDASIGRFISSDDRLGGDIDRHDVFNRYAYVLNNPVADFDPEGHDAAFFGALFAAVAVGGLMLSVMTAGAAAPLTAFALGALGGVITSVGVAGATYAFSHTNNFDYKQLGTELAVAAAVGVVGTGVAGLMMKGLGVAIGFGLATATAGKLTLGTALKIAVSETVAGIAVGAVYSTMYAAIRGDRINAGDVAIKSAWGAAGGLVAGGVLAGVARGAQQPVASAASGVAEQIAQQPIRGFGPSMHYIPAPTGMYSNALVQKTVHIPRNAFGALSKMAATHAHGPS